jgi:UPF0042 nucleotide-binding protein
MSAPADKSDDPAGPRTRVVLVTGMSGAGKSTSLKALEDLGYEAVDNIPLPLLANLLKGERTSGAAPRHDALAADVDIRTRDFTAEGFLAQLEPLLARPDLEVELLYLHCDDEILAHRYTETRRRHPLAEDRPLMDGIRLERELVARLRDHADTAIDTTLLSPTELRRLLAGHFRLEGGPALSLSLVSFAYRRGLPREADLVFDVRFLANPHYERTLRPLDGHDRAVGAFIARDPAFAGFFDSLRRMVVELVPRYEQEGKTYLTIAVGCTGGRHRSVFVAERLAEALVEEGRVVTVRHRDSGAKIT